MNWSGGALSRSRSSNTSRLAAQKRNFAKARGRLSQTRQSFDDFDFSTLEHARVEIEKEAPPRQSPARQTPQRPRSSSHGTLSLKKRIKSRASEWSPSLHSSKLNQSLTSGLGSIGGDVKISAEAILEVQKQELLAMKDWCGLENTRPAKISFPDIADVDQIGKRRPMLKASRGNASRRGEEQPRVDAGVVEPSKRRKLYLDGDSDKRSRKDKTELPCRDSGIERIAMDTEHNGRYSNSEEMLLDTTVAKYSGASFNSDENLFDLENAIQAIRQRSPVQFSNTRPSPQKNVIGEGDLTSDQRVGQFDAVPDLSQKVSSDSLEERRVISELASLQELDNPRNARVSGQVQRQAGYSNAAPHQGSEPRARPTRSIQESECYEQCVPSSPAIYHRRPSDACIHIKPSEASLDRTCVSKGGIHTTILTGNTSPFKKEYMSPLARATLSDINKLKHQSIGQPPTATSIISRAEVTDTNKMLPSPGNTETVVKDSDVLASQEATTGKREKSLSPETVWRKFVLGSSDEESSDKYEFTLPSSAGTRCPQKASANIEPPSMDAEPSSTIAEPLGSHNPTSPVSTDELAPSPAGLVQPKIFFTKPVRFEGERSGEPKPQIRLGCPQRAAMMCTTRPSDEDDIMDD
ncbi:hypothetical protein MMC07_001261 [Pseudocyphellaria aurata]|nr:hypothetical protein [Pseudocyphellaria aurata]